ncbi:flagellar hook protein FlgE [Butyrivibrio sp. XPD2006]|uniref:flagellar hook protein FlgE n=1 Tax=Butyrivibrio sp. XPD2006 TaxID=1280668 RepID=UPI0003B3B5EA|nr:flagellar hook-basal body complex protein [Butyrivibrio sp. XPD2006]
MMRSMWSAVAGLKTHQLEMDVIGNNIANVNTTAYKSQATGFADILYQTVKNGTGAGQALASTNAAQVGLGSKVSSVYTNITKTGSMQTTDNVLDLMITGDAFFTISGTSGEELYTRDGTMDIDANGNLVMRSTGYYVKHNVGVGLVGNGLARSLICDETKTMPGTATTASFWKGNIDRDDTDLIEGKNLALEVYGNDGETYTLKFTVTDNADGNENTYQVLLNQIVDKDGNTVSGNNEHKLLFNYNPSDGTLDGIIDMSRMKVSVENNAIVANDIVYPFPTIERTVNGADGNPYIVDFGIYEDGDGFLVKVNHVTDTNGYTVDVADEGTRLEYDPVTGLLVRAGEGGSTFTYEFQSPVDETGEKLVDWEVGPVAFDFSGSHVSIADATSYTFTFNGDASVIGPLTVDFSNTTNYASPNGAGRSSIYAYKGDTRGLNQGYPDGDMTGIFFTDDGSIYGKYSNGQDQLLMQISFARFPNAMGLEKAGNNLYSASLNSGDPMYYYVTENGGYLSSGVLESSNVDLAKEFTDMITTQRGFQANSRVITTSDEMLQILKGLKR